ncbi:MAG TPA: hypothetical protein VMU22_06525 [Rhizomicrobium sp.]|nr:hypothetical protein [Rhizomicrobium sp.]
MLVASSTVAAAESVSSADVAVYNAELAVSGRLQDPDAAEFRHVAAYRPDASIRTPQAVCGQVGARTGFDRYNGYRSFVWVPADDVDHGTAYIGNEANRLQYLCRNATR